MAFRLIACVILMKYAVTDVAPGSTKSIFPLKDCLKNEVDILWLLEYDRDHTWKEQQRFVRVFQYTLSILRSDYSRSRWLFVTVLDRFTSDNATVDVNYWSFGTHSYVDTTVEDWNSQIPVRDISIVVELKVQLVGRLFKEIRGVRNTTTHVGVIFLDGASLTQEEIRYVPTIVQRHTSNVKIYVVMLGNKLVDHVAHLIDTILLPNMKLYNVAHYLLMAMCNICSNGYFLFEHKNGGDILSCYSLSLQLYHIGLESAFLAGIETAEEMSFLQKQLTKRSENHDIGADNIQIAIGLRRDFSNYAKRFQWVTTPGRYRPLLFDHWLPDYDPILRLRDECGAWQFNRHPTTDQNKSNLSHNVISATLSIVEGWTAVACESLHYSLWETSLPRRVPDSNFISIAPAPAESVNSALAKGNFWKFQGNIRSISTNEVNQEFLQFLSDSKKQFPIFDCGEDAGDRRYIFYSHVCDFVDHCINRRDELSCLKSQKIFGADKNYCSSRHRLLTDHHKCDIVIDCKDGSDEKNCINHNCKTVICYDGSCLPLQWLNDGEPDCFTSTNKFDLDTTDESSLTNMYLLANKTCSLICNRDTCIELSQLNDGETHCTGSEGPLDETVGKLEPANTCRNVLGDFIWAPKCHYIKDRYGGILGCRDMSHLRNCENFQCGQGYAKCPDSYCIPQHYLRDEKDDCPTGEDEKPLYIEPCFGHFACWNSQVCLHPDLVCNGYPDCPHDDDELDCHRLCPSGFLCVAGTITVSDYNRSVPFHMSNLSAIDRWTRYLDLSGVELRGFDEFMSENIGTFLNLQVLILSKCNIRQLYLPNAGIYTGNDPQIMIKILDISNNLIDTIFHNDSYTNYYRHLNYLNVSHNRNLNLVNNLKFNFLETLDLSYTSISFLDESVFTQLPKLKHLNLSHTFISDFTKRYFSNNSTLESLDLRGILTKDLQDYFFHGLKISQTLYTDHFQICCPQIQGLTINSRACIAAADVNAISSCFHLIGLNVQRVLLWVVAVIAVLGNTTVIVYRVIWDRSVLKTGYGLFVTNLSISDFIMGVYLLIIAGADHFYRDNYVLYDKNWRNSAVCKCAGVMVCLSCEASTFFVFLITLDRFLVMKFPFGQVKLSRINKTIAVTMSWVASFLLSLVPVVFSFDIYSSNTMCLGLPLTNTYAEGWGYSVGVFIIFNFVMFLFIACGQYAIFRAMSENRITQTATSMSRSRRAEEITVAKHLSLVVLSNFLFWFPVGLMGLMSLGGHDVSNGVYTWTTVLLLPINSAVNPVLYTIPALMARWEKFKYGDQRM